MKYILVIASYQPDQKLITLVNALKQYGIHYIVVVDDGSGEAYNQIFNSIKNLGCHVIGYNKNHGKGYALKYGFQYALDTFGEVDGFITADDDGQHKPKDILNVFNVISENPNGIILGVRNFKNANIPVKSRLGNLFSSLVFRMETRINCPDTQTGLRGIPKNAFKMALDTAGDRYEYEMNFLYAAVKNYMEFIFIPIETVYMNNNEKSHFRPIADSVIIYKTPIKFALSSLLSAASDVAFFALLEHVLFPLKYYVTIANIIARILSGLVNYTLNRVWSFNCKGSAGTSSVRYFILFIGIMVSSTLLVSLLSVMPIPNIIIKIFVDILLFALSYFLQKIWVFK